jgi:subtilisin-like proprotein convertase family protein
VRVEGTPREGQLVLHAAGTTPRFPVGPGGTGGPPGERISSAVSVRIRDQGTATQSATYAGDCVVASLDVEVDIRHTCPSDLRVQLRSPAGTVVNLQTYAYRRMSPRTFGWRDTRALQRLAGEQARGTWDLIVRDDVDADVGTFESFAITFQCQAGGSATGALPAPAPASAVAPSAGHRGSSEVLDPFGPVPSRPARHRRWLGSSDPLSGLDSRDGNTGGGTNRPVINPWDP